MATAMVLGLVVVAGMALQGGGDDPPVALAPAVTVTEPPTTQPTTTVAPAPRQAPIGHPGPTPPAPEPTGWPEVGVAQVAVPERSRIAQAVVPEVGVTSAPDGPATMVLGNHTSFGSPRVFLLTGSETTDWVEVWLPVRPNGTTGWVQRDAVHISTTTYAVGVDLAQRAFTLFDGGVPVLTVPVAIGRPGAPTPVGTFFVTDLLQPPSPGGSYGPYAFGMSGFSDVYSEFQGGDGQVGFHGTNEPWSIGQAASAGCVRLPNEAVAQLAGLLPLGTPVVVA